MNKHCVIDRILDEHESHFVKDLFKLLHRPEPKEDMLAHIKQGSINDFKCPYHYSFAYDDYCANQCFIKEYLEDNKDFYKTIYERLK